MDELTLYIANKNYSSWSLRAALAVELAGVECDEVLVRLYQPDSRAQDCRATANNRPACAAHRTAASTP